MQHIRDVVDEQIKYIEPCYNITFKDLQALYQKASIPGRLLEALVDTFVFGYAMGRKAAKIEKPQRKEVSKP